MALAAAGTTAAAKRVAFVVGNADYAHVTALRNPANDAREVALKLEALGFEVFKGVDLSFDEFGRLVRAFSKASQGADAAVFFYAGHGLQLGGKNYLAPIDAEITAEDDLPFETIELNVILSLMQRRAKTSLVFLDACRDNPMARAISRNAAGRSVDVGTGLARVETGVGTMISFATQPGNIALDGEGNNSPFTTALLKHIETPDLDIALMMRLVREDVMSATSNRQIPWTNSSLIGEFKLKNKSLPAERAQTAAVAPAPAIPAAPEYPVVARTVPQALNVAEECVIGIDPGASLNELLLRDVADFRQAAANCRRAAHALGNDKKYIELASIAEEQTAARAAALSGNAAFARAYGAVYPNGLYTQQLNAFLGVSATTANEVSNRPPAAAKTTPPAASAAPAQAPVATVPAGQPRTADEEPVPREQVAEEEVAEEEATEIVVAAATPDDSAEPAKPRYGERELARLLQRELNRLGCNAGTADGIWGRKSRKALQRLVGQRSDLRVASRNLDAGLLDDLKALNGRICPLVCGVRQVNRGDRCVAKTCPSGQRLSSRGQCYTPRQNARTQQRAPVRRNTTTTRQQQNSAAALREKQRAKCARDEFRESGFGPSRKCIMLGF